MGGSMARGRPPTASMDNHHPREQNWASKLVRAVGRWPLPEEATFMVAGLGYLKIVQPTATDPLGFRSSHWILLHTVDPPGTCDQNQITESQ